MKRLISASLRWLKGIGVGLLALVVAATLFGNLGDRPLVVLTAMQPFSNAMLKAARA